MSQGRIVEQGSFDQLYWNASHPSTNAMLGANKHKGASAQRQIESEIPPLEQLVR